MQPTIVHKYFLVLLKPISRTWRTFADIGETCEAIKEKCRDDHFSFNLFTEKVVVNVIFELSTNKACMSNDIPMSISKQSVHVYCTKLTNIINNFKNKSVSWYCQNCSNNSMLCHPKDNKGTKENYWPVSTLLSFSKLIHQQLSSNMELKFPSF